MRKLFPLLLILLCLAACKKQAPEKEKSFIIQGTIDQHIDSLSAFIELTPDSFVIEKVPVEKQNFKIRFATDSLVQIFLFDSLNQQHTLYIYPYDSLSVTIKNGKMNISGKTNRYTKWSNEAYIQNNPDSLLTDSLMPGLIRKQLKTYYNNNKKALQIGSRLPYVSLIDEKSNTFTTMAEARYQLFTFWALWDSVSISRVKELNSLSKKLKNKDIAFISICLESNDSIWKKRIETYSIPGRNAMLTEGFAGDNAQKLGINSLPQNILVNQTATILKKNLFGKALEEYLMTEVPDKQKSKNGK